MEKAVRHSDGRMISMTEWAAIKRSARAVLVDLIQLPPAKAR